MAERSNPRVCVIGAGISGITSAKNLKEAGIDFTVFESTNYVGGTWRYDPRVGVDENGVPLHTSMYKDLRTNLPKQTMELDGFPIPDDMPSFPSWNLYYKYIKSFVKHFQLDDHIKFLHEVESVKREGQIWEIKYKSVLTGEVSQKEYDYVFVSTGHCSKPSLPNVKGEETFKGTIIHSHDYRTPDPYRNRRVLVVGGGPSAVDIGILVANVSSALIQSTHSKLVFGGPYPPHYQKRPDLLEFTENGVYFTDGTFEEIDDVIYCTGFQYYYPFLDESSGLELTPGYVQPLYRYMVNVNQPTMVIFGVVVRACVVTAIKAQVRYAVALVQGNFTLPPRDKMFQEWQKRATALRNARRPMSHIHLLADKEAERSNPRVCVIGAGISGITSAKNLKEAGIDFTVFESTNYVGGTWRYDPRVGVDENGVPLHTSMYKDLRTNLPKQTMELDGFPIPDDMPSFPSWNLYYKYIKSFVKHFQLDDHIKFLHEVESVKREGQIWKIKYKSVLTGEVSQKEYDYVFVSTGHCSKPSLPNVKGEETFKGTIIHSHDYRTPDPYRNRRVLVVGGGPSAVDIGILVANVSSALIQSTHSKLVFGGPYPPHYQKRPDLLEFTENGVYFTDGTFEEIDDVIYCTGFQYYYPFLDESSGLELTPGYVQPLYRYMVNVNQPTMVIFGVVVRACVVTAIKAQVRYAVALVQGNFTLPPRDEMFREWQKRATALRNARRPMSHIHLLAEKEDEYYQALSEESGTQRIPPVFFKIRIFDIKNKLKDIYNYRNYVYKILDNNTFTSSCDDCRISQSNIP